MELDKLDAQTFSNLIGDLGFSLLPPTHPGSPGYSGLLVAIRKRPTGEHFDPQTLILPLYDGEEITWRRLSMLTPASEVEHICPGRLILADRLGKRLEFFTFGGTLKVITEPDAVLCAITSPAPILELVEEQETVADWLAAEAEAIWARTRSKWGIQDDEFERRLAQTSPLSLYTSTLHSVLSHWKQGPGLEQTHALLGEALAKERHWLKNQGLWPTTPLTVEQLLAPDL